MICTEWRSHTHQPGLRYKSFETTSRHVRYAGLGTKYRKMVSYMSKSWPIDPFFVTSSYFRPLHIISFPQEVCSTLCTLGERVAESQKYLLPRNKRNFQDVQLEFSCQLVDGMTFGFDLFCSALARWCDNSQLLGN